LKCLVPATVGLLHDVPHSGLTGGVGVVQEAGKFGVGERHSALLGVQFDPVQQVRAEGERVADVGRVVPNGAENPGTCTLYAARSQQPVSISDESFGRG